MKELITNEPPKMRLPDTVCQGKGEYTPWNEYMETVGERPPEQSEEVQEDGRILIGEATLSAMMVVAKVGAQSLPDTLALQAASLYDDWEDVIGKTVDAGFKFRYGGKVYKTIQPKTIIQKQYVPGIGTESLYTVIDEGHAGTKEDPIPAAVNMEYEYGKYYSEEGVIYLCQRGGVSDPESMYGQKITLQFLPSQLIGQYFVVVE